MNTLPLSFYTRADVLAISRELLGKVLVTEIDGEKTAGIIVETEAYAGPSDRACHAFQRRHTARTAPMFLDGGIAYIYLIYGLYHLFNIVTNSADEPYAILVRAIEPLEGKNLMLRRRGLSTVKPQLCGGPGTLSRALGITTAFSGTSLQGPYIRIEDRQIRVAKGDIVSATRVGVAYAGEDALLPYRFFIRDNLWVSKAKGL